MTSDPVAASRFVALALAGDAAGAHALIGSLRDRGRSASWIIANVLAPAQVEIGRRWETQEVAVAQEHLATAISVACVDAMMLDEPRGTRGRVLVTGVDGEWHTLPAQMLAQLWRSAGLQVLCLTPSLPVEELQDLVAGDTVCVAAISCALPAHFVEAWQAISTLRVLGLRVIAGGAAFARYPDLAEAAGADLQTSDAMWAMSRMADWVGGPRRIRPALTPVGWSRASGVWDELPRVVLDARRLVWELHPQVISDETVKNYLDLLARVAVASVTFDLPAMMSDHLRWYRRRLAHMGLPETLASASVRAVVAVLPHGSGSVAASLTAPERSSPRG